MTTNRSAFAEPLETSRGRQPLRRTGSKRTRTKGADRSQSGDHPTKPRALQTLRICSELPVKHVYKPQSPSCILGLVESINPNLLTTARETGP
jgi:hypothetical protein